MGNKYEVWVWVHFRPGEDIDSYQYELYWAGAEFETALGKALEAHADGSYGCVKLEMR